MPSSRNAQRDRDSTTSASTKRRFQALRGRSSATPSCGRPCGVVDRRQVDHPRKALGQARSWLTNSSALPAAAQLSSSRAMKASRSLRPAPTWARRRSPVRGRRSARAPPPPAAAGPPTAPPAGAGHSAARQLGAGQQASAWAPAGRRAARAAAEKRSGRRTLSSTQVGQQVELLEDVAEVVGAVAVARAGAQALPGLAQQRTAPACGSSTPAHRLSSVLLPQPLGPRRNTLSPGAS
jgi:sRNA-binding protein